MERLVKLELPFDMDVGAPIPKILANENDVEISYYIEYSDGRAFIKFDGLRQFKFGYPNEEAISGHDYFHLGLSPYDLYEVINSKWIKSLKEKNRVHPYHTDEMFSNDRHFILPLHDNTFEVIAISYETGRRDKK